MTLTMYRGAPRLISERAVKVTVWGARIGHVKSSVKVLPANLSGRTHTHIHTKKKNTIR